MHIELINCSFISDYSIACLGDFRGRPLEVLQPIGIDGAIGSGFALACKRWWLTALRAETHGI